MRSQLLSHLSSSYSPTPQGRPLVDFYFAMVNVKVNLNFKKLTLLPHFYFQDRLGPHEGTWCLSWLSLLVSTLCSLDGCTYMTWIFCKSQSLWSHNKQEYWKDCQVLLLLNNTETSAGIHLPSDFTSIHAFLCADISSCLRYGQIWTVCWLLLSLL